MIVCQKCHLQCRTYMYKKTCNVSIVWDVDLFLVEIKIYFHLYMIFIIHSKLERKIKKKKIIQISLKNKNRKTNNYFKSWHINTSIYVHTGCIIYKLEHKKASEPHTIDITKTTVMLITFATRFHVSSTCNLLENWTK